MAMHQLAKYEKLGLGAQKLLKNNDVSWSISFVKGNQPSGYVAGHAPRKQRNPASLFSDHLVIDTKETVQNKKVKQNYQTLREQLKETISEYMCGIPWWEWPDEIHVNDRVLKEVVEECEKFETSQVILVEQETPPMHAFPTSLPLLPTRATPTRTTPTRASYGAF